MKAYADRREAGLVLAPIVAGAVKGAPEPIVLGLPRGGVPVAAGIAAGLGAPLDVVVVRKIGFVGHREMAMGAVATVAGTIETVSNEETPSLLRRLGRRPAEFTEVADRERLELVRLDRAYRGDRPPLDLAGRTVVLVDDGAATGASLCAAVGAVRHSDPARVVIAVPVCLHTAINPLREAADQLVCPWFPEQFMAVGQAYQRFDQTEDEEVRAILGMGREPNR